MDNSSRSDSDSYHRSSRYESSQGHQEDEGRGRRPYRSNRDTGGDRRRDNDFRARGSPMDNENEMKIYGVNACRSFFENRPEMLIRAYFSEEMAYRFGYVMKACAKARKAYRIVSNFEMEKIAETKHHQGACFLIKKNPGFTVKDYLDETVDLDADCIVALERLGNPHNVGAILRTCAHFGVEGMLVNDPMMAQSGAAVRTAEGGAEYVQFIDGGRISDSLPAFKAAGYQVVATSSNGGENLYKAALPDKMVLLMGPESTGLSEVLMDQADVLVKIPGSENVESLNVATATGILLGEYWRQKDFAPGQPIVPMDAEERYVADPEDELSNFE